jgi:hypothetical protein
MATTEKYFFNYLINTSISNTIKQLNIHSTTQTPTFSNEVANELTNKKMNFLYSWQESSILFLKNRNRINLGTEESLLEKESEKIIKSKFFINK